MMQVDKDTVGQLGPMEEYRKQVTQEATEVVGPMRVVTQSGPIDLPEEWHGWIGVDQAGHPYPIDVQEFLTTYTREGVLPTAVVDAIEQLRWEIENRLKPSRERSLMQTKLDEVELWATRAEPFGAVQQNYLDKAIAENARRMDG